MMIKRWDWCEGCMEPNEDGNYVLHEDHLAEVERVRSQCYADEAEIKRLLFLNCYTQGQLDIAEAENKRLRGSLRCIKKALEASHFQICEELEKE